MPSVRLTAQISSDRPTGRISTAAPIAVATQISVLRKAAIEQIGAPREQDEGVNVPEVSVGHDQIGHHVIQAVDAEPAAHQGRNDSKGDHRDQCGKDYGCCQMAQGSGQAPSRRGPVARKPDRPAGCKAAWSGSGSWRTARTGPYPAQPQAGVRRISDNVQKHDQHDASDPSQRDRVIESLPCRSLLALCACGQLGNVCLCQPFGRAGRIALRRSSRSTNSIDEASSDSNVVSGWMSSPGNCARKAART